MTHLTVTGKFALVAPFREPGHVWPASLGVEEREQVLDLAGRSIRALGVTDGITHTEVKLTPEGPRLIEVNGRLGGFLGDLIRRAGGSDPVALALDVAVGRTPIPRPPAARGTFFAFSNLAPAGATELVAVSGGREAGAALGGRHVPIVSPGSALRGASATEELDLLSGWAADHAAAGLGLERALSHMSFTFRRGRSDGLSCLPALSLPSGCSVRALRRGAAPR